MLCYSSLGLPRWPVPDLCILLKQFGYDGIELALTREQIERSDDNAYWGEMSAGARETGIPITCLHLGNPELYSDPQKPRLLNEDKAGLEWNIELISRAFEIAESIDCRLVAAACGTLPDGLNREVAWGRLERSIQEILEERRGPVDFLIEHEPEHFIRTVDDILQLFDLSEGQVFCNLDVGHLEVSGDPIGASIERLGSIIKDVHLEDIQDRRHQHLMPGDGEIDFGQIAQALKKIGYAGPVTVDLYPFADRPIPAIKRAREAFSIFQ